MQKTLECGIIETNQRWLMCPMCRRQKLARIVGTTQVKDLYLYCRRCNQEVNIAIEPEP